MGKYLHTSFHALGDPTRLAVVERLIERAGLIRSEKRGRVRTCFIHPPAIREIDKWLTDRRAMWEGRLDRLANHIDTERKD
jgi:hypothetical protein